MSAEIQRRLKELGLVLPAAPAAVGDYVPVVQTGDLCVTSGQLPFLGGEIAFTGKVGREIDEQRAAHAARQCAVNALAQLQAHLGDLSRIRRVVRVEGYVQAAPGFTQLPAVMNGASRLFVELFGDAGRHTRIAVGASELPLNAAVELAVWVEVRP